MKLIRMTKTMAGPEGTFGAGKLRTVDDATATMLIEAEAAEVIALIAPATIETASVDPVIETAARPKATKKKAAP